MIPADDPRLSPYEREIAAGPVRPLVTTSTRGPREAYAVRAPEPYEDQVEMGMGVMRAGYRCAARSVACNRRPLECENSKK